MHRHKNAIEIRGEYPIGALQVKRRSPGGIIERIDSVSRTAGKLGWEFDAQSQP
jgi:hypothetical protein